jgi:hypothetical protein
MNQEVWPNRSVVEYVFPGTRYTAGKTVKVTWTDGEGTKPSHEVLSLPEDVELPAAGSVLIGEQGSMIIPHVAAPRLYPKEKFASYVFPELPKRDHYVSWADACRGEDHTTSLFSYSGPLTEAVLLGTIALRFPGEMLQWSTADLKISNVAAANEYLTKPYRKGWALPG